MTQWRAVVACAMAAFAGPANACAASVPQLRVLLGDGFALHWREVSMSDGLPLLVRLADEDGRLALRFTKTGAGLWAEGPARVCRGSNGELDASITRETIRFGPAAPWLLRRSLGQGARFILARLPDGRMRIAAGGWSGDFQPGE